MDNPLVFSVPRGANALHLTGYVEAGLDGEGDDSDEDSEGDEQQGGGRAQNAAGGGGGDDDDDDEDDDSAGQDDDAEEEDGEEDEEESESEPEPEPEPVKVKKEKKVKKEQEKVAAKPSKRAAEEEPPAPVAKKTKFKERTLEKGLKVLDLALGSGAVPSKGKTVKVLYTGTLTNGKEFDKNVNRKAPFKFRHMVGEVVAGMDKGVAGMKVGGKRRITIPAHLGYGKEEVGPIPKNSTLIFEIELLAA
jgi:FKBP-type peptidyl-prolyl cis-trans isomerase